MELFAVNEEVLRLEAELACAPQAQRLTLPLSLAWQLRQRDSAPGQGAMFRVGLPYQDSGLEA